MERITIFTPTYNRKYCLGNLYQSLLSQTSKDFMWLIVDDGSNDGTRELIELWIGENKLNIRYVYQENAGKAQAHNRGVVETDTELFACVDSDDTLDCSAVESVLHVWDEIQNIKSAETIIGILAKKIVPDGTPMTIMHLDRLKGEKISTLKNAYDVKAVSGDTFLIYCSSYIKRVSFPKFEGEKFVPESYIYDELDQMGKLYFLDEALYYAEYLQDGISKNFDRIIANNPNGYLAYIEQRLRIDDNIKSLCGDIIRYISVALLINTRSVLFEKKKVLSGIMFPFGYLLYRKRFYRFKVNMK